MTQYPLVVRNKVPLFYRGFMLTFLGMAILITWSAARGNALPPDKWWPYVMALFLIVGAWGVAWSMNLEVPVVRITNPRSIHITRGKAFRREELWTDRARFWIEDSKDSDGDAYFKLMMDAPVGKLTVKEGHQRAKLEALLPEIEAAVSGR